MTNTTAPQKSKGPAPTVDQINADRITQVSLAYVFQLFKFVDETIMWIIELTGI